MQAATYNPAAAVFGYVSSTFQWLDSGVIEMTASIMVGHWAGVIAASLIVQPFLRFFLNWLHRWPVLGREIGQAAGCLWVDGGLRLPRVWP